MRTILLLLTTLLTGFVSLAQAPQPAKAVQAKPKIKTVFDPEMLGLMLGDFTAAHLRTVYDKALQVKKVTRNKYEPSVRDTMLAVTTRADKLTFFANKYNSFLLSADVTSQQLTFGHGIRVGSSKAAFCKEYKLPATFDAYQITDEASSSLYFLFRQGILTDVTYHAGTVE